jgi:hypothetical protein
MEDLQVFWQFVKSHSHDHKELQCLTVRTQVTGVLAMTGHHKKVHQSLEDPQDSRINSSSSSSKRGELIDLLINSSSTTY